jgi:hypothetical protein
VYTRRGGRKPDRLLSRNFDAPLTPVACVPALQSRKSSPVGRIVRDQKATNCLPRLTTLRRQIRLPSLSGGTLGLAHRRQPVAEAVSRRIRPFAQNWPHSQYKSVPRIERHAPWSPGRADLLPGGSRHRAHCVPAEPLCAQPAGEGLFLLARPRASVSGMAGRCQDKQRGCNIVSIPTQFDIKEIINI